mmetsp:Transcript_19436/g.41815  ORF Transcript_19436/g.41815 Transcript_19436/m.41815 type:complete len:1017 (+) Transcript_19436:92-3142(+)|eukprot:CAMPEP_0204320188 /NCGR_PEP_ID=MMETSP0469-20131031/7514_1 /ASSEMBLY_ACC=CAM_ASM_000384 /TAXON_ID=2969 /ORGANISM="Oxyrrhis marina" /LENGTH=1016 /DNA_ID=CAMNT_0051301449 /DNA_START=49 /DNA_END=3099 /DNA_ORIENTATION=-
MEDMEQPLLGNGLAVIEEASQAVLLDAPLPPTPSGRMPMAEEKQLETLETLRDFGKARRAFCTAKQTHERNARVSRSAAICTLVLSSPFWCWPLGEWLEENHPHVKRFYCTGLGTMILQILFTIYVDLGNTTMLALQGVGGTFLAWANSVFLDKVVFGRTGTYHPWGDPPQSSWLPLCLTGHSGVNQFVDDPTIHNCFLNILWEETTAVGFLKVGIVLLDLVLFVGFILYLGFDVNTRAFSLSTMVWFLMALLDPSVDAYGHGRFPQVSTNNLILVVFGSSVAMACMYFPTLGKFRPPPKNKDHEEDMDAFWDECRKPTVRALERATYLGFEAAEYAGVVLDAASETFAELVRIETASAHAATVDILDELRDNVRVAWWETMPPLDRGEGGRRRRWLEALQACLRDAVRDVSLLHETASKCAREDAHFLTKYKSLDACSAKAQDLIRLTHFSYPCSTAFCQRLRDGATALLEAAHGVEAEWLQAPHRPNRFWSLAGTQPNKEDFASSEAAAFLFAFWGVMMDTSAAVEAFANRIDPSIVSKKPKPGWKQQVAGLWNDCRPDRGVVEPAFVLRNTVSIMICFCTGIIGAGDVLPAYTWQPASVVSVIIFKHAVSGQKVALDRLTGVVLGKVLGTLVILGFAIQEFAYSFMYAAAMYMLVSYMFYSYVANVAGKTFVACLTVSYAASAMVPTTAFRDSAHHIDPVVLQGLLQTIINAVVGVSVMTVVDLCMAPWASSLLSACKQHAMAMLAEYAEAVCEEAIDGEDEKTKKKLQKAAKSCDRVLRRMKKLYVPAAEEPKYDKPPLKDALYTCLDKHLTEIHRHVSLLRWCTTHEAGVVTDKAIKLEEQDLQYFRAFFPRLAEHVGDRMHNMQVLAHWVTRAPGETQLREAAREVRGELMRRHFLSVMATQQKARVNKRKTQERPVRRLPRRVRKKRGIIEAVFSDEWAADPTPQPPTKVEVREVGSALNDLEMNLGVKDEHLRGEDTLYRVGRCDLMVGLVRSLLDDIKAIEVTLLEF